MAIGRQITLEQIVEHIAGANELDETSLQLLAGIASNASELVGGIFGLSNWPSETVDYEASALSRSVAVKPVIKAARLARLAPGLSDEELERILWSTFQFGAGDSEITPP